MYLFHAMGFKPTLNDPHAHSCMVYKPGTHIRDILGAAYKTYSVKPTAIEMSTEPLEVLHYRVKW